MTTEKKSSGSPKPKQLTAAEWGALKAAEAPPWSDRLWRQACAALNVRVQP